MNRHRAWLAFAIAVIVPASAAAQFAGSKAQEFVSAVRSNNGDKVKELIESSPEKIVDSRDLEGETALLIAVGRRDEDWTVFLLGNGADPNLAARDGRTPLITAARIGYEDAVHWLISQGARVDATNRMGETALIVAVQQRHPAIVRVLLRAGANPDLADGAAGLSARDYAKRDSRSRDILRLIDGAKPAGAAKP